MKKFLLTLASLLFISTVAMAQRSTVTKFEGEPLSGLIVSGAFDVNISLGTATKVVVSMPDDAVGKVSIELTDDKYVRLGYGNQFDSHFVGQKNRPKATIVLSKLAYVNLGGAAMLIGSGTFPADKFVMIVDGSAFASFVMVDCVEASLDVSGTAKIEDIRIAATKSADFSIGGSSKATIGGSSPALKIVASGTSSVDLISFVSPAIEAITSGTSLVKASVDGKANVHSSGISSFKYVGAGVVSGSAKRL